MCSVLHQSGDAEGGGREVSEIDKLLSSARFDNTQHVKSLAAEEQRTAAAQKQIAEKQAEIKILEESTSRCDSLAKELHQRLRRARDNCESSKRTSTLLDEHITAVMRKQHEAHELREVNRAEKQEKLQHYQRIWESFQQAYGNKELAKELASANYAVENEVSKAERVEHEIDLLQEEFSCLSTAVSQRKEYEEREAEAKQLNIIPYVLEMAEAQQAVTKYGRLFNQVQLEMNTVCKECQLLELALETMAKEMHSLQASQSGEQATVRCPPDRWIPAGGLQAPGPSATSQVNAQKQGMVTGAAKPSALSVHGKGPAVIPSSMPSLSVEQLPGSYEPTAGQYSTSSAPQASAGSQSPEPMQSSPADEANATPAPVPSSTPMEVAPAAESGTSCGMPPMTGNINIPASPKTPQGASTPKADRTHHFSPGFGLQKPMSPLDSFHFSGRPMFNASKGEGQGASPSLSPGQGMPFFQSWSSQKRDESSAPQSETTEATEMESPDDSDPAGGFLAIAASLAPPPSDPSQAQSSGFFGGGASGGESNTTGRDSTPFSMFGTSSSGSSDSGFSFAFGGGTEPAATSATGSNDSGTFSFSFGGGSSSTDSTQPSSGFSFGSATDSAPGAGQPSSGFSFGGTTDRNTQAGSGFSFPFGPPSSQQSKSASASSFSLF